MKPTLFIALGGTGMELAHRLRQRILGHSWGSTDNPLYIEDLTEFPLAQFIYFDLDVACESKPNVEPVRFRDEERICQKLDIDKYLRTDLELYKYPHIDEWFPLTRKKLLEFNIDRNHAPGQIRAFSRLNFFDKYAMLKHTIQGKIRSLLSGITNRPNLERLGLRMDPASLRIVVLSSAAGGTGSGAFIDMGYLTKWLAKNELREGVKVDLYLMLSSGYKGLAQVRCEANTYASLMELEACMGRGDTFVRCWSSSECPDLPQTPFDDIFLFDAGNIAHKRAKASDLFDMVAETLFEDIRPSEFSSRKRRISTNMMQWKIYPFSPPVDARKYGSLKLMCSRAYSAFGQASIDSQLIRPSGNLDAEKAPRKLMPILEEMSVSERRVLFQECMERAMPWVDANLQGVWSINPDQYLCVIGVDDALNFEKKFGDDLKTAIPDSVLMPASKVLFFDSGVPDKLTCYVELSGLPLTALTKLPKWRESYEEENKRVPIHIHKDRSLFVHPLSPSSSELDRLAEHFKLYIQAIVLGVLKPYFDEERGRIYCFQIQDATFSIGNERLVRLEGLQHDPLEFLRLKISQKIEKIETPSQWAGLAAIFDFYAARVYPPVIMRDESCVEYRVSGFGNVMCAKLCEEAKHTLSESTDGDIGELISCYADTLDDWTDEIEDSNNDAYEYEVHRSHLPKRVLKKEYFQEGWLETRVGINEPPL